MRDYCTHAAALPVHTGNVWWKWCHYCFTWEVSTWTATQSAEETMHLEHDARLELGPFDGPTEVLAQVNSLATHALLAPGRPWDSGPRSW